MGCGAHGGGQGAAALGEGEVEEMDHVDGGAGVAALGVRGAGAAAHADGGVGGGAEEGELPRGSFHCEVYRAGGSCDFCSHMKETNFIKSLHYGTKHGIWKHLARFQTMCSATGSTPLTTPVPNYMWDTLQMWSGDLLRTKTLQILRILIVRGLPNTSWRVAQRMMGIRGKKC